MQEVFKAQAARSPGRLLAWLAAGAAGLALTGCVVAPVDGGYYDTSGGYYDSGYDTYYDSGSYYPGGGDGYYNGTYYPAIPREVVPVAPFVGALWIGGHWDTSRGNRRWVPGRYDRPGHGHNRPGWNRPNDNRPGWNRPDNNRPEWNRPNRPNDNRPDWSRPSNSRPEWRPLAPVDGGSPPANNTRPGWNQQPNQPNVNRPGWNQPSRSEGSRSILDRPAQNRPAVTQPAPSRPSGWQAVPPGTDRSNRNSGRDDRGGS